MNITIPPEALEAGARAIRTFYSDEPLAVCDGVAYKAARAAFLAMIEAWPGMEPHKVLSARDNGEGYDLKRIGLILPLTENTDDDADKRAAIADLERQGWKHD